MRRHGGSEFRPCVPSERAEPQPWAQTTRSGIVGDGSVTLVTAAGARAGSRIRHSLGSYCDHGVAVTGIVEVGCAGPVTGPRLASPGHGARELRRSGRVSFGQHWYAGDRAGRNLAGRSGGVPRIFPV